MTNGRQCRCIGSTAGRSAPFSWACDLCIYIDWAFDGGFTGITFASKPHMKSPFTTNYKRLRAELVAIERWDHIYYRDRHPSNIERDGKKRRQERREEIISELVEIVKDS